MRKLKQNSPLFQFLEEKGLIGLGKDDQRLIDAKREYRRNYLRLKKSEQRAKTKSCTITMTPVEYNILVQHCHEWGISLPQVIKLGSLSYFQKTSIAPLPKVIREIRQEYFHMIRVLREIAVKRFSPFGKSDIELAIDELKVFQNILMETLQHPYSLEESIQRELERNPPFIKHLTTILNDFKEPITQK